MFPTEGKDSTLRFKSIKKCFKMYFLLAVDFECFLKKVNDETKLSDQCSKDPSSEMYQEKFTSLSFSLHSLNACFKCIRMWFSSVWELVGLILICGEYSCSFRNRGILMVVTLRIVTSEIGILGDLCWLACYYFNSSLRLIHHELLM